MKNIKAALELIQATSPHFDIWALAGDHNKPIRKQIMFWTEGKKVPIAKSGINAIREKLYAALEVKGDYIARQDIHFAELARKVIES